MKSKEENNIDEISNHYDWTIREKQRVLEFAKQEAIEFAEFLKDNSYTKSDKGWYQFRVIREDFPAGYTMATTNYDFYTIEQIFELYLTHKNTQP